jgi:protein-S-isoprenylcysteine O-methyltransferase Ste14
VRSWMTSAWRLLITRLLVVPVVGLVLLTGQIHAEGSPRDRLLPLIGLVLLLAAMGGRIWASAYVVGRKDASLVTEGPYSLVRNPLYLSSLAGFTGAGLVFESLTVTLVFVAVFFLSHWPAIRVEERKLEARFGAAYVRYREEVPRFIPRLARVRTGERLVLDTPRFQMALRDCLAIPLVFVAAELLEWAKLEGVFPVLLHIP